MQMPYAYPTPHSVVEEILEATVYSEAEREEKRQDYCAALMLWMMEDERGRLAELADTPGFTDGESDPVRDAGAEFQRRLTASERVRFGVSDLRSP